MLFFLWLLVSLCYNSVSATLGPSSLYLNGLSVQPGGYVNASGHIPRNVLPTRIEAYKDEVFLVYPRYRTGVSLTLGVVNMMSRHTDVVKPFPSQEMQALGDCRALQSAESLFLDEDNILWVLDTGIVESMERAKCVCPPKVIAVCVETGQVVRVVDLSRILAAQARPQFVVAEGTEDGSVYIYISDAGSGSSVWCVRARRPGRGQAEESRSVETRRLRLPTAGRCDVLYMVYVDRLLLLHCRGATDILAVHTARLRGGQLDTALVRLGPTPAAAGLVLLGTDRHHTLYYRFEGKNAIFGWDTRERLSAATRTVVAGARDLDARLAVAAVAVAVAARSLRALAVDSCGYVAGRVGCVGAEARIFSIV